MMNSRFQPRTCFGGRVGRGCPLAGIRRFHKLLTGTDGAQLLEFAMGLPFLLVIVIGIIDFAGAYNVKQKMANAAREGARMVISNNMTDTSCSSSNPPCAVQAAANAVANYMTNDGVNSSCINPTSPSTSGTLSWTYTCPNGISLAIDRGYTFTASGGSIVQATKVTLTYPYTWTFGRVIGLLVRGAHASLPSALTTTAVMQNITN